MMGKCFRLIQAAGRRRGRARSWNRYVGASAAIRRPRQPYFAYAAGAVAGGGDGNAPAVCMAKLLHDRQAEAAAPGRLVARSLQPLEWLEYVFPLWFGDPGSVVCYPDKKVFIYSGPVDHYRLLAAVGQDVLNQVAQDPCERIDAYLSCTAAASPVLDRVSGCCEIGCQVP